MWRAWRGDLFVASLKFDMISRLSGAPVREVERLSNEVTGRIRDLQESSDGSIWFLSETEGALFRVSKGR
jgi:glucose/arabinose dehydrogenase